MSQPVEILVGMEVDVDGAPNAYGPPGKPTLDFELNAHVGAKSSGAIVGYITKADGRTPETQQSGPFKGYFISTTAFQDRTKNRLDTARYVDASKINYVVRGSVAVEHGVHLGDFVAVHSIRHNTSVFGIVGDDGNSTGAEGSLALLRALGHTEITSGKTGGVDKKEIIVRYFPGSNPDQHFFKDQEQIDTEAVALKLSKDFSTHH
jgi:hypothetical protein